MNYFSFTATAVTTTNFYLYLGTTLVFLSLPWDYHRNLPIYREYRGISTFPITTSLSNLRILDKKRYLQIGDLKSVQKLICSDQRSEHSKACCHDGMCLRRYKRLLVLVQPHTHAVTTAGLLTTSIPTAYHRFRPVGRVGYGG